MKNLAPGFIVLVLLTASARAVNAGPILDSAKLVASQVSLSTQVADTDVDVDRRSQGRFWAGVTMVVVGAATLLATQESCSGFRVRDRCVGGTTSWPVGRIVATSAVTATGTWLAWF